MWKITFGNWETFFSRSVCAFWIVSRSLNKPKLFKHYKVWRAKKFTQVNSIISVKEETRRKKNLRFYPLPLYRCRLADLWSTSTPGRERERRYQFAAPISLKLLINLLTFRGAWRCLLCNWQHNPLKEKSGEKFVFKTWLRKLAEATCEWNLMHNLST